MKKIEKYLEETLGEQEVEEITQHLIKNKFDKETRNRWAKKLKEEHQIDRSKEQPTLKRFFRFGPKLLSVAAGLLLLLGAFWIYQTIQPPSVDNRVALHLDNDKLTYNVARKDTAIQPEIREKFSEAFNQENYALASRLGEDLLNQQYANSDDYFFIGLSHLYQEKWAKSIDLLENAKQLAGEKGRFVDEMNWFLSLAYIKIGNEPEARRLLQQIVEKKAWHSEEAAALLKALQSNN